MTFDAETRAEIARAVLCWCATVDGNGQPNVSPKEVFRIFGDDGIVIADIASPGTVRNLGANSGICLSMVDVFRQTGVKLVGSAKVIDRNDPLFASLAEDLLRMVGDRFPIRNVILAKIGQVHRIVAPSYRLFPEMTVQQRVDEAMQSYGVRPA
jgi:uncharacterized protein